MDKKQIEERKHAEYAIGERIDRKGVSISRGMRGGIIL